MKEEFLPSDWNSDMPMNVTNVLGNAMGVLAILETSFVSSFPYVLERLRTRKGKSPRS